MITMIEGIITVQICQKVLRRSGLRAHDVFAQRLIETVPLKEKLWNQAGGA
jgi:hypothetical protein